MNGPQDPRADRRNSAEREERQTPEVLEIHGAAMREMSDPVDGVSATPVWLLMFCFFFVGWGGWYLAEHTAGFRGDEYREIPAGAGNNGLIQKITVDPMILGKRVFNNCTQCHQDSGQGMPGTYPPLAGSEYVNGSPETLARVVLHGLHGELTVKGQRYNGEMPYWRQLKDEQIAAVMTYIRASWGNQASSVDAALVERIRKEDAGREKPLEASELKAETPLTAQR